LPVIVGFNDFLLVSRERLKIRRRLALGIEIGVWQIKDYVIAPVESGHDLYS
jgi:hypothetical protein